MNIFLYLILCVFIVRNFIVKCDDEAYHWDAHIYPNLTSEKEAKFCTGANRNPPSSVCDPDQVLAKYEGNYRFVNVPKIQFFKPHF